MSHPNKVRGTTFERELVNEAKRYGFKSERAYGSNGKALGEAETVDLKINNVRVQAKRRKAIASFLQIPEGCEAVVFREDRGNSMVLISLDFFLQLLHERDYGHLPKIKHKKVENEQNTERQDAVQD